MPIPYRSGHSIDQSEILYTKAKRLIPGGTQLLSKRPEMYAPERWPAYYQSANGCEIADLDGNKYIDMSLMGVGTCLLGYADSDVNEAVIARIRNGSMCTLNAPSEVQLTEELIRIHPWAQQARLFRTGGEAAAAAIRIARSATGRDVVAFCGYHGWHDWYLASNHVDRNGTDPLKGHLLSGLSPSGVPSSLAGTAHPFTYNKLEELDHILAQYGEKLAAVIMEPVRNNEPLPGFLEGVRSRCDSVGAVLIFDEISSGWRFAFGGAHLLYGVEPDLAVFAKAMGNGHPIAAVVGREAAMQAAQNSFISSTYWTEAIGPVAALATLAKMRTCDVPNHVRNIGLQMRESIEEVARVHNIKVVLSGLPAMTSLAFDHPQPAALTTLFTARMLERGILCGASFYPSLSHQPQHIQKYLAAADEVFVELAEAIRIGDAVARLNGHIKHIGFQRLA